MKIRFQRDQEWLYMTVTNITAAQQQRVTRRLMDAYNCPPRNCRGHGTTLFVALTFRTPAIEVDIQRDLRDMVLESAGPED